MHKILAIPGDWNRIQIQSTSESKPVSKSNPRREAFIEQYCIDRNATQAAIRAGYSKKTAKSQGQRLLTKVDVAEKINERLAKLSEAAGVTAKEVLDRWWSIATADANELSQHRRIACRYCHGKNHEYQWIDENEWAGALLRAQRSDENAVVDHSGGFGYRRKADPHPDCPKCEGDGEGELFFSDTRKLSATGKLLYAGVKQTQSGMEIKTRDQDAALLNIAKHLGMFTEKIDHTSSDGSMSPKTFLEMYGKPKPKSD